MAAPTRSIRVKFDGDAKGLKRAAEDGADGVDKARKRLDKSAEAWKRAGASLGIRFGDGMVSVLGKIPLSPQLALAALGIAAAMAPVLGAGLAAAVLGGVGAGGILGGIAGAASDPQVRGELASLAMQAKQVLGDIGVPFVLPLRQSLAFLRTELHGLRPELTATFAPLATTLMPLTRGLRDMVRNALPGMRAALAASAPLLRSLARDLPILGKGMGAFLDSMAKAGPGAARFFTMLINFTSASLATTGKLIELMSRGFEHIELVAGPLAWLFDTPKKELPQIKGAADLAFSGIASAAGDAGKAVEGLNEHFDRLFGRQMDLQRATDDWTVGILGLKKALQENGKTLDASTEKGIANRNLVRDQIDLAKRMRDAAIEQGDGTLAATVQANAAYASQLEAIRKVGIQAGLSAVELDKLLAPFRNPPPTLNLRVKVTTSGNVPVAGLGTVVAQAQGGIIAAQRGMIARSPMVLFGERQTDEEGFVPKRGIPRGRGLGLTSHIASWYRASVVPWEQMDRNGGPEVLHLTLDLGEGIQQVVRINLREHDRGLKQRVMAGTGRRR